MSYEWITTELLDELVETGGVKPDLALRITYAALSSPSFTQAVDSCVKAVKGLPLGNSRTLEHKLVRTAMLGGIEIGIELALRRERESKP